MLEKIMKIKVVLIIAFLLALCFCLWAVVYTNSGEYKNNKLMEEQAEVARLEMEAKKAKVQSILSNYEFPSKTLILASTEDFIKDLEMVLSNEDETLVLVDKKHPLPVGYVPPELVKLDGNNPATGTSASYVISRNDLSLTPETEKILEVMASDAREEGITLVVSSTYRSYEYQDGLYKRNVAQLGQEAADRESARPGTSQHQFGTAVDFGSITDDFAQTEAGIWLARHAGDFGWSLSYPDGYEDVTGYRWECWHYRYLGVPAVQMQQKWFGGIQQYMLEFIHAWKEFQGLP